MSEDQNSAPSQDEAENLLESRKELAREMGIQFHPSIGLDTLNAKIEDALQEQSEASDPEPEAAETPKTKAEVRAEATKLVRVRVINMNPMKKDYEGEFFACGNKVTGTIRKYVHFGVEWHVPQIILNMMRDKKFQTFVTKKVRSESGVIVNQKTGKLVPEYAIEVLPPLTDEERKALAQRQAMANGTSES